MLPTSDRPVNADVAAIRAAMPEGGMFRAKEWLVSPRPFPIDPDLMRLLNKLGPALLAFQRACDALYHASAAGEAPPWIAQLLDQGKPPEIIALARHPAWRHEIPRVLRPDLILTEQGVGITELDSVPGGIGLTGWLGETYASLGSDILGGPHGMVEGFSRAFPEHDILVSRESGDYQPEMEWLVSKLNALEGGRRRVLNPWSLNPAELEGKSIYRFFELWDIKDVEQSDVLLAMARRGALRFSPPLKQHLEEKLWLALFWMPGLRGWWRDALQPEHLALLERCIPYGWVLDPAPIPVHAEYPHLGIQSWQEMKGFGNRERELVIKISGYSETAWGSRGVHIGHDLSQEEWRAVTDQALADFPRSPHVLQRFHRGRLIQHPLWDEGRRTLYPMQGRVRLCPYYFIQGDQPVLGGALATIVPADKKILHGMRDAAMVPCTVEKEERL